MDLRRRSRLDQSELILARAEWIHPADRALLVAIFGDGKTVHEVACLIQTSPRSAGRRVRRLVERVTGDRFAFVLRHHLGWSAMRRRVAIECVLHGRSVRQAARALSTTLHAIRRHVVAIDALYEQASRVVEPRRTGDAA